MTDTIDGLIRVRADNRKPMVIDPGTRISYAELEASTAALGAGLLDAGMGKGAQRLQGPDGLVDPGQRGRGSARAHR